MTVRPRAVLASALIGIACPSGVRAHAFEGGADAYARFVEGVAVPSSAPAVLLCLVPLGLLLGAWRVDGLPAVWPALLLGLAAGIACGPLAAPWVPFAALAAGVLCAGATALAVLPRARAVMAVVALVVGLLAGLTSLEGHAWGEVPVSTLVGILFGSNLAVALPAAMVSASTDRWRRGWVRIGWRIVSSWSGAIAVMYLAFELRRASGGA